jgi:hypothetical protein
MRIRIQGLDDQKLEKFTAAKKIFIFFLAKNAIYLSVALHKESPSYRTSPPSSKEDFKHFKAELLHFCGSFWPPGSRFSRTK